MHGLSLVEASEGCSLVEVCGLLTGVAFLVADPRAWASVVMVLGLSCSAACGIFLDHGSCLLHWQVDSWPLDHSGNPTVMFYAVLCLQKISIGLI